MEAISAVPARLRRWPGQLPLPFLLLAAAAWLGLYQALLPASENHMGKERFRAYSAGSHPRGEVHPLALQVLSTRGYPIDGLRSKSWDEFARSDAPKMDFIFTVCDRAAGESCPAWPGQPITAHWGFADPVAARGDPDQQLRAFVDTQFQIAARIRTFLSLPLARIDRLSLQNQLRQMGEDPS